VLDVPWVDGVKTGHTNAAGYILVASGTQHGVTFVSAVLGDPSEGARDADALALLRWAFAAYRVATPVASGAVEAQPSVKYRPGEHVDVIAARSVQLPVERDAAVRVSVSVPDEIAGPLARHAAVGTLTVRAGHRVIARVRLLTARALPKVALLARAGVLLARPSSLVVIVAMLGGLTALLLRRRGTRRRSRRRADMEAA
jgi:D-alanyl-D-alanine carboxypeptidase (penicillin-binding protein 5/6)